MNKISRKIHPRVSAIPNLCIPGYNALVLRLLNRIYDFISNQVVKKVSKGRVLDVGCGTCTLIVKLCRITRDVIFIGLDLSEGMIKLSRRIIHRLRLDERIDLILADAHYLPFRKKSINLLISTSTLHHLRNPTKFIYECVQVSEVAWIYELSHDCTIHELIKFSRMVRIPLPLIKLASTLHGMSRREFLKIISRCSSCRLEFLGPLTKLVIS